MVAAAVAHRNKQRKMERKTERMAGTPGHRAVTVVLETKRRQCGLRKTHASQEEETELTEEVGRSAFLA
jgi:hypothetical protein